MPRQLALTVALLATLAATFWLADDEEAAPRRGGKTTAAVDASRASPARPTADAALVVPDGEALRRDRFAVDGGDLFPAPQLAAATAAAGEAGATTTADGAAAPFRYQGMLVEGADTVLFLAYGNCTVLARAGDTLDGVYQVESVGPAAATFLYRP